MRTRSNFEMVKEFHETFVKDRDPDKPTIPEQWLIDLRFELIEEELKEFREAVEAKDLDGVADALTDILYVVYGAGLCYGIPLDKTFEEVHRSNMSKLGEDGKPVYRADGKVLKGPNWSPPDFSFIFK